MKANSCTRKPELLTLGELVVALVQSSHVDGSYSLLCSSIPPLTAKQTIATENLFPSDSTWREEGVTDEAILGLLADVQIKETASKNPELNSSQTTGSNLRETPTTAFIAPPTSQIGNVAIQPVAREVSMIPPPNNYSFITGPTGKALDSTPPVTNSNGFTSIVPKAQDDTSKVQAPSPIPTGYVPTAAKVAEPVPSANKYSQVPAPQANDRQDSTDEKRIPQPVKDQDPVPVIEKNVPQAFAIQKPIPSLTENVPTKSRIPDPLQTANEIIPTVSVARTSKENLNSEKLKSDDSSVHGTLPSNEHAAEAPAMLAGTKDKHNDTGISSTASTMGPAADMPRLTATFNTAALTVESMDQFANRYLATSAPPAEATASPADDGVGGVSVGDGAVPSEAVPSPNKRASKASRRSMGSLPHWQDLLDDDGDADGDGDVEGDHDSGMGDLFDDSALYGTSGASSPVHAPDKTSPLSPLQKSNNSSGNNSNNTASLQSTKTPSTSGKDIPTQPKPQPSREFETVTYQRGADVEVRDKLILDKWTSARVTSVGFKGYFYDVVYKADNSTESNVASGRLRYINSSMSNDRNGNNIKQASATIEVEKKDMKEAVSQLNNADKDLNPDDEFASLDDDYMALVED